ncbi:hypothetical protein EON83_30570 [bacterium]|nr:MAG: hypothetical protein EON83_30570 [bacterium]
MKLSIHQISQAASGGSYVVIYDAEVRLLNHAQVTVEVDRVEPPETSPDLVELARIAIREGAEHVLLPLSQGAQIQVSKLVINFVDFKPNRFKLFTAIEFERIVHAAE